MALYINGQLQTMMPKYTVYQKPLIAGETTVTYTNSTIDSNSCFDWFSEDGTLIPTSWSVSNHTLTVTYPAQASDVVVGVQILWGRVVS